MGVVQTLVHTHDMAEALGLEWVPPAELCARALARLFPQAPKKADPWLTLLWATGRGELPGHPRLTRWDRHPSPGRRPAPEPVRKTCITARFKCVSEAAVS
jgi:hypothetical protein